VDVKLEQFINTPIPLLVFGSILAVLPLIFMGATPYIKFSIIFNILRNSLGIQNIPSNSTTAILSLVLTVQTILPTLEIAKAEFQKIASKSTINTAELKGSVDLIWAEYETFMLKHTKEDYLKYFKELNEKNSLGTSFYLLPAYILSEIYEGLRIGFILLIPFILIDLLISSILLSLGLTMLSPQTITLPLKIGLMVTSEIWFEMIKKILALSS